MLQEETLMQTGQRQYEEPNGEFLEMIDSGSNTITVLTRVDSDKAQEVTLPFEPSDQTVATIKEQLENEEQFWTDERLEKLLDAEKSGKNRMTAISAIEDKLQ
jgi:hypothetical protein